MHVYACWECRWAAHPDNYGQMCPFCHVPYVEKFWRGKFWQINGLKVFGEEKFGESVGSILKILAFINIGGENFGELSTVCQVRQNFPPLKFSHVWY